MVLQKPSPKPSPSGGLTKQEQEFLNNLINQQGGGSTRAGKGQSSYPGPVWMGETQTGKMRKRYFGGIPITAPEVIERGGWQEAEEALTAYNDWTGKRRRDFLAQAKLAGLLDYNAGEIEGAGLWRDLVKEASFFGASKKNKISPWDLMSGYIKSKGGAQAEWRKDPSNADFEVNVLTGERRYVGPTFKTTTERRVDFTDPATARAIATKVFQDLMGRDPGSGELAGFSSALQAAEAESPVTATTTTEYDPTTGETVGTSTTSTGGIGQAGASYLAEQRAKGTKEYGAVQAATTYQNALENAIWGAPQLGGG